ncbi:hypothetical protein C0993_007508 [Termitomyces sp. T159_Od127]|nr:hypothetical protein C0993_007508 [Termitomyces sp. T159_Od127]
MTSQGDGDKAGTMDPASMRIADVMFQAVQTWLVAQFQAQDTKLAEVLACIVQLEAAQAPQGLVMPPMVQALLEQAMGVQVMQHVACAPRINPLEVYNSKSKPLADQFVQQVEAAAEFKMFQDNCQKILWAQSYLSGSAQQWSSVITMDLDDPAQNPCCFQWDAWVADFKASFCTRDQAQDALTWIRQLQQGSKSITDYCTAFFELKGRLGQANADSKYVKDRFWKSLIVTTRYQSLGLSLSPGTPTHPKPPPRLPRARTATRPTPPAITGHHCPSTPHQRQVSAITPPIATTSALAPPVTPGPH